MSQDTSANASKKRQADSELTQGADKKWKRDLVSSSDDDDEESYSSDSGGALSESASPSTSSSSVSEEDASSDSISSSEWPTSDSEEEETQTKVTDFDVCEARYHLLHDSTRPPSLTPERRAAFEVVVDASIYGPLKRTSFELGTADRYDLFAAYASALLGRALPVPPTINQLHSMIDILKF